jgi:hypothetical protein
VNVLEWDRLSMTVSTKTVHSIEICLGFSDYDNDPLLQYFENVNEIIVP